MSSFNLVLNLYNDILMMVDSGNCAILVLLDLSAAFHTIDHNILISRLKQCCGFSGVVLDWFKSYLTDTTF